TSGNVYTFTVTSGVDHTITVSAANYNDKSTSIINVASGGADSESVTLVQQTGSATITVTSEGNPLAAATVTVDGTALTGTTDASGVATINNIPVGSYTFTVNKPNYTNKTSASTTITNGGAATVNVALMSSNPVHVTVINPTAACNINVYRDNDYTNVLYTKPISLGGTVTFDLPELYGHYYTFGEDGSNGSWGSGCVPTIPTYSSTDQVTAGSYTVNMQ
ncbi:MAG: carboxypeptidase-like regulatory domain-containing protein, partial [Pelosinus sp.]|nr:carboxypeptidase-like regulatory domain-containing protein [Pelosinus sp.]